jgi:hypothetical protein
MVRVIVMVVAAGMALMLVLTRLVGSAEGAIPATVTPISTTVVANVEPTATASPTPHLVHTATRVPATATPQPTVTPTAPAPTPTSPPPTEAPVEPTPTSTDDVVTVEETDETDETAEPEVEEEPIDAELAPAAAGPEPVVYREVLSLDAGLDSSWDYAIHTPGGGVMGLVGSTVNVRSAPLVDAPVVREVYSGHLVVVYQVETGATVAGSGLWYMIGPDEYVSAAFVSPFVAPEPTAVYGGNWLDVNLSLGYAIAWSGDVPVYAAIIAHGKPGFETPIGEFTVFHRVFSETLDSATVGIPAGDPEAYYLEGVLYTQYFAEGGFALHTNYWDAPWELGGASSHGCINLLERDAAWLWDFLTYGSVVSVHY